MTAAAKNISLEGSATWAFVATQAATTKRTANKEVDSEKASSKGRE